MSSPMSALSRTSSPSPPDTLTLISATPSPYARKNRIALLEKGIPFTLESEIPWHSTTITPLYNPLEKLPILLFPDGRPPVYESWLIQEYIVTKYKSFGPDLMPQDFDSQLSARNVQVLADGGCDAMGQLFFEIQRECASEQWIARQKRKIEGVLRTLDELVSRCGGEFLVGGEFSIADIAAGCFLGMIDMVEKLTAAGVLPELTEFTGRFPGLKEYWEGLEMRESFRETVPVMFELSEKVV